MKEKYTETEIETVFFNTSDVVTASRCPNETDPIIDPDFENP